MSRMSYPYAFTLDDHSIREIKQVVSKHVLNNNNNNNNKEKNSCGYFEHRITSTKNKKYIEVLIKMVVPYFKQCGFSINEQDGYFDFSRTIYDKPQCDNRYPYISSINSCYSKKFKINNTNDTNDTIHGCFLCIRKDEKLKHGNAYIYEEYPTLLSSMGFEDEKKEKIEVEEGTLLILPSNVIHAIEDCAGVGQFDYVFIAFKECENKK